LRRSQKSIISETDFINVKFERHPKLINQPL
jgi:hypothetical protein